MRHASRPKAVVGIALLSLLACAPVLAEGGEDGDWELGVYSGLFAPDSYADLDPDGGLVYGLRVGYFFTDRWSVEGSWQTLDSESDELGGDKVDLSALRVNALYNFRPDEKFRWFLTAGLGSESTEIPDADIDESDLSYNLGGGLRWYFGKSKKFGLRVDGRWVQAKVGGDVDENQTNYEATGGIYWSFGGGEPPDSDGDFVKDSQDACAGTPKGARVDSKGCPSDADADGVADGVDKCDGTPRGWKVDATGCPADADGDGIADGQDACPGTVKGAKVDQRGCPTDDEDGDGVADGADRCPKTPKGAKVDMVGCPTDADGDGVWDGLDACPDTPKGTAVDERGCPKS